MDVATQTGRGPAQPVPADIPEIELSIVMPCLNESLTIETCIRKAQEAMAVLGVHGEVIVADNGSTDGSLETAESLGARVVRVPARGYGSALTAGCRAARGRYILMGDADNSYDFSRIEGFLENLRSGDDLVMGTRLRGRILPGAMPWKNRYIGNPILTWVLRRLYGARVSDAHCGMRAFSRSAFERMDLRTPGMEFASEMLIKAAKLRMRITEVPITFHPDGRDRQSHLKPWRDGWRHVKLMLMFSPTTLFLLPGATLVILGLALMITQLFAPPDQPGVVLGFRLDFHWAILGSFLTIVGYQLVVIHMFARVYSVTHRLQEEDRLLARAFRILTLNRVLVVAGLISVAGAAIDGFVVVRWLRTEFGPLVSEYTRLFILGSTLLALGLQTMFSAFFFSILGDAYRRDHGPTGLAGRQDRGS